MRHEIEAMRFSGENIFVKFKDHEIHNGHGGMSLSAIISDYNFLCAFYNSVVGHLREELADVKIDAYNNAE